MCYLFLMANKLQLCRLKLKLIIVVNNIPRMNYTYYTYSSWMATLKNDLSLHNLTYEDAIEMALDKPLWRLLAESGATH